MNIRVLTSFVFFLFCPISASASAAATASASAFVATILRAITGATGTPPMRGSGNDRTVPVTPEDGKIGEGRREKPTTNGAVRAKATIWTEDEGNLMVARIAGIGRNMII